MTEETWSPEKLTESQQRTQQLQDLQQQITMAQATSTKIVVQKLEEKHGFLFKKKATKNSGVSTSPLITISRQF